MRRESCEPTMMHSSIALLQERFRQLERAKEMRQQKELLRLFSDVEPVRTPSAYEPSKYVHSELMLPPAQHVQGTLYAQPSMQSMHTDLQVNETPKLSNLQPTDTVIHIRNDFDESDVDTSLHL